MELLKTIDDVDVGGAAATAHEAVAANGAAGCARLRAPRGRQEGFPWRFITFFGGILNDFEVPSGFFRGDFAAPSLKRLAFRSFFDLCRQETAGADAAMPLCRGGEELGGGCAHLRRARLAASGAGALESRLCFRARFGSNALIFASDRGGNRSRGARNVRFAAVSGQDWVSQNFARSISVESSLKDIREEAFRGVLRVKSRRNRCESRRFGPVFSSFSCFVSSQGGHDVKKAHQKYVGKFQALTKHV